MANTSRSNYKNEEPTLLKQAFAEMRKGFKENNKEFANRNSGIY